MQGPNNVTATSQNALQMAMSLMRCQAPPRRDRKTGAGQRGEREVDRSGDGGQQRGT